MPRTADGRPLSYVALNGHGAYPRTGFIPRIFLAFNDYTGKGEVFDHLSAPARLQEQLAESGFAQSCMGVCV